MGLCCVALPFTRSADFAIDKPPGTPCRHLTRDDRCGIHDRLGDSGFAGCVAFDCFGAGQHVSQGPFSRRSWRDDPESAREVFETFHVMLALHEMVRHLDEAETLAAEPSTANRVRGLRGVVAAATGGDAADVRAVDVAALRSDVGHLLAEVSRTVRGSAAVHRSADLVGARLAGADLRRADLRGALLVGADLTGADLRQADVLGCDLRGADLSAADLSTALFLTQPQVDSARGSGTTQLPAALRRPPHWRP